MPEIKIINIGDKDYPEPLKSIKNPPKTVYCRGELLAKENCFAIVGSRLCSPYGKQVASEIAGSLAQAGLTIVSGLAPGIDTSAHWAAVERGKRTIAVLGTGIDNKTIYPKSNLGLAEEILKTGGCLISEYPEGSRGTKFTFPQRNRIISGLSKGILVVEAKEKSGALITAEWARIQGRKIFAVPGLIHSLNSRGCHFLIKKGAKLAESAADILNEFSCGTLDLRIEKKIKGDNTEESSILNALKEEPLDIEKIIERAKLSPQKAASTIAILEINGKIKNLGGNIYGISNR